jgi:DNA polymerase III subunit beta
MRIKFEKVKLVRLLETVSRSSSANSERVEYAGIRIEAEDDNIRMNCTNGMQRSVYSSSEHTTEIEENGKLTVNAKLLNNVVKTISSPFIRIETQEEQIVVSGGTSVFTLSQMNDSSIHEIKDIDGEAISIDGDTFKIGVESVIHSVDPTADSQLNGVNLRVEDDYLWFVATDRAKAAFYKTDMFEVSDVFKATIPIKVVSEILRIITTDCTLLIKANGSVLSITNIQACLSIDTRELSGDYPNITKLLDEGYETTVVCNQALLLSSLERARVIIEAQDKGTFNKSVKISTKSTGLTFAVDGIGVGTFNDEIIGEVEGESTVHVDAKAIYNSVRSIRTQDVIIGMRDEEHKLRPVFIKSTTGWPVTILMPIVKN